jgi:eukaryotic-like serine/threonine-protein kinase
MSKIGIQSAESSGQGLTFVRPLPRGGSAPHPGSDSSYGSRHGVELTLTDRLFPPRHLDDSGAMPPVTGLELGHFVIEERIGRGGMGAVFRAIDRRLDRVVALKVLSPELSRDPEAVQRFQNEARAAARLDHENIARVYYIGEEKSLHFIGFEFVTGTNVREFILQKGKLAPADAVNYTLQIAEALRHTAAANVVHRDIKPSNIIIAPTGRAKLVDLGLARHSGADVSLELTVAGTALGTFDYISPEQAIDARNVDVRSDIYSLGCTLYHMLTGEPPYPKGTMFEKVMNHHRPVPPDASRKNPRVSPQLARVVQKMMASSPDERYASPDTLIADLVQIAEQLGLQPAPPDAVVWTSPLFPRRNSYWDGSRSWMAVALVLLLLVFLVDKLRWDTGANGEPALAGGPAASPEIPSGQQPAVPPPDGDPREDQEFGPADEPDRTEETPEVRVAEARQRSARRFQEGAHELLQRWDELLEPVDFARSPDEDRLATDEKRETSPSGTSQRDPLPELEPFVVLSTGGELVQRTETLAAACKAAGEESVIEIHADGMLDVQQEPLKISGKRIRIRPGRGYRPVLRFDLAAHLESRSFSRFAEMIEISTGNRPGALELYDLDLELVVDAESPVQQWSMVSLHPEGEFTARGVSFTLINPKRLPAALLYLPEDDSASLLTGMPDRMSPERTTQVRMTECIARGEFDLVEMQNISPARFELKHVATAVSGFLFRIDGSDESRMAMDPEESRTVAISLNHVTAIAGEGLIMATSGDHGTLPVLELSFENSLFRIEEPGRPLVKLSGNEEYDMLLDSLKWQRGTDPSFYQIDGPLGLLESLLTFSDSRPLEPGDVGVSREQIIGRNLLVLPASHRLSMMHRVRWDDFQLREDETLPNPARFAAEDGRDAGVDWERPNLPDKLPTLFR